MKTCIRIAVCLLLVSGVSLVGGAQELVKSQITAVVPERGHEDTVVRIYCKAPFKGGVKTDIKDRKTQKVIDTLYMQEFKGDSGHRVCHLNLEKNKTYQLKVEADIQPNNYTHIFRAREIALKGGENVKLEFTAKDPKERIEVRWVPTPDDIVDDMCKLAKVGKNDVVYDLGCGDSVMLIRPIQKFGAKRGVGIDIKPEMVEKSKAKIKAAGLQDKIEVRQGDILDVKDMSEATVVLLYIGDELGERLSPVLRKTMKPGARIVSHRFKLGDWQPTKTITVEGADAYEYELHLWVVPERKLEKGKQ